MLPVQYTWCQALVHYLISPSLSFSVIGAQQVSVLSGGIKRGGSRERAELILRTVWLLISGSYY